MTSPASDETRVYTYLTALAGLTVDDLQAVPRYPTPDDDVIQFLLSVYGLGPKTEQRQACLQRLAEVLTVIRMAVSQQATRN